MAGLDLNKDYQSASDKIGSYQTVKKSKEDSVKQAKEKVKTSTDKRKSDVQKSLNDLKNKGNNKKNEIKNQVKNQLDQLLDLFRQSLPKSGGGSLTVLTGIFLQTAMNVKTKLGDILVDEIISTIGCSEEQDYNSAVNQPFYIKVSQADLFKRLLISPEDENGKFYYEKDTSSNGVTPYSMNRQLYDRLQNPSQSFSQDPLVGNGQSYIGESSSQLFDIQYVQSYIDPNPPFLQVTGDFFKVTLKPQLNNRTSVSDFLRDYYGSIDILNFDVLSAEVLNSLTGSLDFGVKLSSDGLKEEGTFNVILKRIMGLCDDPNKPISTAGTAKLSDIDNIDDSFFEISNQELRVIEQEVNNVLSGVIEYEDCNNVQLPINVKSTQIALDEILSENKDSNKISLLQKSLNDITNDPKWKSLIPNLGIDIDLKSLFEKNLLLELPKMVFKTILSPKVMLGMLVMIKVLNNETSKKLDDLFDTLQTFMKSFKKFVVNFMRKITSIFVEEIFKLVKKNVKLLVESILMDIVKEAKNKQISMYASIVYILLVAGQGLVDFRNCKSVIDEILKLLNLGLTQLNLGLPQFILSGAQFLGGVSDTRATANTIENLQKLGLPTGDAPDGGPNLMNMALMSVIKGQNKEQAENGKTEVAIPPLSVIVPGVAGPGITLPKKGYGKSY